MAISSPAQTIPAGSKAHAYHPAVLSRDATGTWSTEAGADPATRCVCRFNLLEIDGKISGSGMVQLPGDRMGRVWGYEVELTGTRVQQTISLELIARFTRARFSGTLVTAGDDIRLEGRLAGFGVADGRLSMVRG